MEEMGLCRILHSFCLCFSLDSVVVLSCGSALRKLVLFHMGTDLISRIHGPFFSWVGYISSKRLDYMQYSKDYVFGSLYSTISKFVDAMYIHYILHNITKVCMPYSVSCWSVCFASKVYGSTFSFDQWWVYGGRIMSWVYQAVL